MKNQRYHKYEEIHVSPSLRKNCWIFVAPVVAHRSQRRWKCDARLLFSCGIEYITLLYLDRSRCSATNIIHILSFYVWINVDGLNSRIALELCCSIMRLCLTKGEEKIEDVCICEDRCVYVRKRTFDWLGNWFHFDISSFEKTENVYCVCICAQANISLAWKPASFRYFEFWENWECLWCMYRYVYTC